MKKTVANYYGYSRKEILPMLPENVSKVLEIGCGTGNTLALIKQMKGCEWTGGVEICSSAAKEALSKVDMVCTGNIESINLDIEPNSLDLILCLDVLEHLVDPLAVLNRLYEITKLGGSIIIILPNVRYYKVSFNLLFLDRWDYAEEGVLDKTHLRFFVKNTAVKLLENSGYKISCVSHLGPLDRYIGFMTKIIPQCVLSLFTRQYMIKGIK